MNAVTKSLLGAALLSLGACAHSEAEKKPEQKTNSSAKAPPPAAAKSHEQLALDDAEKALKAANDEFLRSGNSAETQRLTDIAMQKVDQANVVATTAQCRDRAAALQAKADGLHQQQEQERMAQAKPPPEPAKPPPPSKVSSPEGAIVVSNFKVAQWKLSDDMKGKLDAAVKQLEGSEATVVIEGHADDTGTDAFNDRLSLRRAAAGRDYLMTKGVDASRIEIKGAGARSPIELNDTADNRAKNRRIELVISVPKPVS